MSQNCYNATARRTSRDEASNQEERLTRKHIQTLAFVQDVVNENKQLKEKLSQLEDHVAGCAEVHAQAQNVQERIKQIQEDYLRRADDVNQLLTDKHVQELNKKDEDYLQREQKLLADIRELQVQLEASHKTNRELTSQRDLVLGYRDQVEIYEKRIAELNEKIEFLQAEINKNMIESDNQMLELKKVRALEEEKNRFHEHVKELEQKNKELEYRVRELQREAGDTGKREQQDTLDFLKNNLKKLLEEQRQWKLREKDLHEQINNVDEENRKLRIALADSERMRGDLNVNFQRLQGDLVALKKQGQQTDNTDVNFKEFVALKRQVAQLRHENEDLKHKLRLSDGRAKETITPVLRIERTYKQGHSNSKSDYPHAMLTQK